MQPILTTSLKRFSFKSRGNFLFELGRERVHCTNPTSLSGTRRHTSHFSFSMAQSSLSDFPITDPPLPSFCNRSNKTKERYRQGSGGVTELTKTLAQVQYVSALLAQVQYVSALLSQVQYVSALLAQVQYVSALLAQIQYMFCTRSSGTVRLCTLEASPAVNSWPLRCVVS